LDTKLRDLMVATSWGVVWMLVLRGLSGMGFSRFQSILATASAVPPLASISWCTASGTKVSAYCMPAQAWRICRLAAMCLESLSPFLAANACAVAVWNAKRLAWLALLWASCASACAVRRVLRSIAKSSHAVAAIAGIIRCASFSGSTLLCTDRCRIGWGWAGVVAWMVGGCGSSVGMQKPQLLEMHAFPDALLHPEMHAFPDASLCPEMHAFPYACVTLLGTPPAYFTSLSTSSVGMQKPHLLSQPLSLSSSPDGLPKSWSKLL
jgi:hypothetical protein